MRWVKLRHIAAFAALATVLFMNHAMPAIPQLRSLGARVMVVASGSMRPFLNFGDIVILKGVNPETVKVGDVIAFNVAPRFQWQYGYPPVVTHRVIKVITIGQDIYFQTKGDATEKDPFTVPAADVIGLYAWRIPYAGLPFLFMRSAYGIALIAAYIVMDFTLDYGPVWWRKRREREKAMATVLRETTGIRRALERLSSSVSKPSTTILLRRKESGGAKLVRLERERVLRRDSNGHLIAVRKGRKSGLTEASGHVGVKHKASSNKNETRGQVDIQVGGKKPRKLPIPIISGALTIPAAAVILQHHLDVGGLATVISGFTSKIPYVELVPLFINSPLGLYNTIALIIALTGYAALELYTKMRRTRTEA